MRILFFVACLFLLISTAEGDILKKESLHPNKAGMPGEEKSEQNIEIGHGVKMLATIDVTARRNGVLSIANLRLKVIDEYDDGAVYVGGFLHVEFTDISGDGFKDLVVTGTVINTGEKDDSPKAYSTVTEIYVFDPGSKTFRLVFQNGPKLAIE